MAFPPNARTQFKASWYLRKLIAKRKGLTQDQAARTLRVKPRLMRRYLRLTDGGGQGSCMLVPPYPVFYSLLALTARSFKIKPNGNTYNPDPDYLRRLITLSGLSQVKAARAIGIGPRTMRSYLSRTNESDAPYVVQYCLEMLAHCASAVSDTS